MADPRTILAAVLGIGLGVVLLAFPELVIRAHTAGRVPHDRTGEYGDESSSPARWRLLVRLAGFAVLAGGLYFGVSAVAPGLLPG